MKKRVVSWILVLCTALALVGCGQNQNSAASSGQGSGAGTAGSGDGSGGLENSYSFNVGSSSTAGTTITKTFEAAQQKAQEESGGKLTMTYYGASSLGSDNEMLKECVAGNLPIVVMTTASITGTVPELAVFDMHCAFSSMDTLSAMMEDEEFLAMVQGWFEKAGLKLIAWETQSSKLLASTKEVNTIDDFKGYDMRTLSNKYHIDFWQAVGANTIQIDASELYLSVQQGLINGIEMNMASIQLHGTVNDLAALELCYAPPYSSAKDPVNMAGYVAQNVLEGLAPIWHWEQLENWDSERVLLDVRTVEEYERGHLKGAINIPVDDLRNQLDALPEEREIWVYCQAGIRGYVAQRILMQRGFSRVYNLSGGYGLLEQIGYLEGKDQA